jgi:putative hydrolase of the HAD superfamily
MIKAIAFDLWETLITDTPELSRQQEQLRLQRMERTLAARGWSATAERIDHAYRALWRRCHDLYWSLDHDIPCRIQIEHFLEGLELDPASFAEETLLELETAYANAAIEVLPALVPFADETLSQLKSRGLGIGLISNTGRTPGSALREVLQHLGLGSSIDAMVFSNEHGECKPRTSIFSRLREELGVPSGEVLFVGDNLYADVHGAQNAGMRAVHFVPATRGTAVAPYVDHGLEIVPDAVVTDLRELPAVVERLNLGERASEE